MTRPAASRSEKARPVASRSLLAKAAAVTVVAGAAIWCLLEPPGDQARAAGQAIDLSQYSMTFDEPFDTLDVSAWGPGTRWIAHTPWDGDFGDARFLDPKPDGPFKVGNGMLTITMVQKGGKWQSGLLSSADPKGKGFMQAGGGYFEMRAKLPGGAGVWPAFWLCAIAKKGEPSPEVDALEYYGHNPQVYLGTTHVWLDGKGIAGEAVRLPVPAKALETDFHLYGVSIDPQWVTFYLDRKALGRTPSRPEYLKPMALLVNLAAGGGWPIENMPSPSVMTVDYVRAYRKR
jgi:hypothetical protein